MSERNWHAIEGPNGMCACGVRADGSVVTCGALLEAEIQERLAPAAAGGRSHLEALDVVAEMEAYASEGTIGTHSVRQRIAGWAERLRAAAALPSAETLDLEPIRRRLQVACRVCDDPSGTLPALEDAAAPLVFEDVPRLIAEIERLRARP